MQDIVCDIPHEWFMKKEYCIRKGINQLAILIKSDIWTYSREFFLYCEKYSVSDTDVVIQWDIIKIY